MDEYSLLQTLSPDLKLILRYRLYSFLPIPKSLNQEAVCQNVNIATGLVSTQSIG